eukprot:4509712-Pyramimonas_sp.AAC.1
MTVLLRDTKEEAEPLLDLSQAVQKLVHAEDTLLVSSKSGTATAYMRSIEKARSQYGLQLNFRKLEARSYGCDARIPGPDGSWVPQTES